MGTGEFSQYRESQVTLVTSPIVLSDALTKHPELYNYPRLTKAMDAEKEIKDALVVQLRNTSQVQVGMSSDSPREAADIVNAVVNAYIEYAGRTNNTEIQRRKANLVAMQEEADLEVKHKRDRSRPFRSGWAITRSPTRRTSTISRSSSSRG